MTGSRQDGRLTVPEPLRSIGFYGEEIFKTSDVNYLVEQASRNSVAFEGELICRLLNSATAELISGYCIFGAATPPGKTAAWAREVQSRALHLLGAFGYPDPRFHFDQIEKAATVLRLDLSVSAARSALQSALEQVSLLVAQAGVTAARYEAKSDGKYHVPLGEAAFFFELNKIYKLLYGKQLGYSTDRDTHQVYGPGVRFCLTIVSIISKRIPDEISHPGFLAALERLSAPGAIKERIREMRKKGRQLQKK